MSIIDKILNKKEPSPKTSDGKDKVKADKKKSEEKNKREVKKDNSISSMKRSVIKAPWISEKARDKTVFNQYVFLVEDSCNKIQVKEEVQRRWNVTVDSINMVRKSVRAKRYGGRPGRKKFLKKAIVKLKEGDTIDIYPV
ncbi:MAG: 50S ribosomal protein L23 [Candidatus Paceibacterota bacterium]